MSDPRIRKLDRWNVDFAAAKIALHNLDILVHNVVQGQNAVVAQLRDLFRAYGDFAGDGTEAQRAGSQAALLDRTAANLRDSTARFSGKVSAQIRQAREQVSFMGKNVSKLRSAKPPQFLAAVDQVMQQVPEFLSIFDAFLARLTLELRIQQATFYKELGGAFTHAGRAEPTSSIVQTWLTQFEQIMPAVESLKYVRPQMKVVEQQAAAQSTTEPTEAAAIMAPVKWIHSRVTRDVRDFKFSDPRKGFFNKPTHPPKDDSQTVVAAFDFEGQTESDLAFKRGDVIRVIDRGTADDPNWWCGEFDGRRGLFPRNYIEEQKVAHHQDEYIPRRSGEARRRSGEARRSGDSHRSGSLDDSKKPRATRRSSSLRRSGSLERPALQEVFGEFSEQPQAGEHSPQLPRRPTHSSAEGEDELAPKLPRRPRPSQSESTGGSDALAEDDPPVVSQVSQEAEEGLNQEPSANNAPALDVDVNTETEETVKDDVQAPRPEALSKDPEDTRTSPPVDTVSAAPSKDAVSSPSKSGTATLPAEGASGAEDITDSTASVNVAPTSDKPQVSDTAGHHDDAEVARDTSQSPTAESSGSRLDSVTQDAPRSDGTAQGPEETDEVRLDSDSDDDLQIPDELREESGEEFVRTSSVGAGDLADNNEPQEERVSGGPTESISRPSSEPSASAADTTESKDAAFPKDGVPAEPGPTAGLSKSARKKNSKKAKAAKQAESTQATKSPEPTNAATETSHAAADELL